MIQKETAEKLRDLGFPLISVGKEDHAYAADFCRFCGFPFLKIGETYYLMPVINTILSAFGKRRVHLFNTDEGDEYAYRASSVATDYNNLFESGSAEPDEALCLLWIKLHEGKKL